MKKVVIALFLSLISVLSVFYYFNLDDDHYVEVPIGFRDNGVPYTELQIDEKLLRVGIDLGSGCPLSLAQNELKALEKKPIGTYQFTDVKGNEHETPLYLIKQAKMAKITMYDIQVNEESSDYLNEGPVLWKPPNYSNDQRGVVGSLGRPAITYGNWLFDFPHSLMIATNDIKKLKEHGYRLDEWIQQPFSRENSGLVIPIDTDIGVKRFVIDTGSTHTIIRASLVNQFDEKVFERELKVYPSTKFSIQHHDFGSKYLNLFPIAESNYGEIDGFLGMDFMSHHAMYFDFTKNIVYICPEFR